MSCHRPAVLAQLPPTMPALAHQFDRRAETYEAHAPVQREVAAWLAEWLPAEMPGAALELGAGTGLFTRHVAARSGELLASDVSPQMVRTGEKFLPVIDWATADAATPPAHRDFSWVLSCSLVQWLPDPESTLRAWRRVAAPGARFIGGWFVRGTLGELFSACPEAAPFVWRGANEWLHMLSSAGWRPVRHEETVSIRRAPGASGLLRELHNAGAVVPRRLGPGTLRSALRRYEAAHRNGDGEVAATFRFMRVEAVAT